MNQKERTNMHSEMFLANKAIYNEMKIVKLNSDLSEFLCE